MLDLKESVAAESLVTHCRIRYPRTGPDEGAYSFARAHRNRDLGPQEVWRGTTSWKSIGNSLPPLAPAWPTPPFTPMQDVLGLDGSSRMNLPGVGQGYWEWRFSWGQVKPVHAQRLARLGGCMGGEDHEDHRRGYGNFFLHAILPVGACR